jgi:hypothetical protein
MQQNGRIPMLRNMKISNNVLGGERTKSEGKRGQDIE